MTQQIIIYIIIAAAVLIAIKWVADTIRNAKKATQHVRDVLWPKPAMLKTSENAQISKQIIKKTLKICRIK